MEKISWGILGTGNIAKQFATGLTTLPDAELVAVGSRSAQAASEFGRLFTVPHRHDSYQALAEDPRIDAIYVATPHHLHKENTLLCLDGGKAVICEKPFAINAGEALEMIARSRESGIFLMEAMWTRYMPLMVKVRELLAEKAIGELRMVTADFGFRAGFNPEGRLFDPKMGGGALLDVGIYPVSLAYMVLGEPTDIKGAAHLGKTGVDEQSAFIFSYENGQLAILSTAIRTNTQHEAFLLGSDGWIKIHSPWWVPSTLTLSQSGKSDKVMEFPYEGNGYNYEAAELMACIRDGKLESEIMPLDETLSIMKTLDQLRRQWGLKYPME